jgi:ceramide glucosyltransferase
MITTAQRLVTRTVAHEPLLSLISELLQPFHLVHAIASRRIFWRTRVIDVRADGEFVFR